MIAMEVLGAKAVTPVTAFAFVGYDPSVPIYVCRCAECGTRCEVIQKIGAAAPAVPTEGCPVGRPACHLKRQLTTASHRFGADYTSDGIGGYQRQGDTMIRQISGKNSERYGTDSSGHS